jgi:hypothetical protein
VADQETKRDSSARVQIMVALIGLAGVIATALISNWDKIIPKKNPAPAPVVSPSESGHAPERKPERTGQGSEHPVHSSGSFLIGPGHFFDLDTGIEQIAGADFSCEHKFEDPDWFLTPQNGAAFYVVGATTFELVRWSDMEHFPYSTEKIIVTEGPSNRVPAGTVVAYKTNEGRLGKFIVDRAGYGYAIRWRTYD